ncbi:MAG: DUF488 domain-containing protein [Pseudomonadota bacterium]
MEVLTCNTVGHSTLGVDAFIDLIKAYSINCIADVRSAPWSKHNPQFNREALQNDLKKNNIKYLFMGDCLGARYDDPMLLFSDGRVDFSKVRCMPAFQNGIERIQEGLRKGYRIALMCAERDPFDCHRFVLVARELAGNNILVQHIISVSDIVTQQELETRLLEKYSKNTRQLTLFDPQKSLRERVGEAYALRNREIAYTAANPQGAQI